METQPYTEDEIREKFLRHIRALIQYWTTTKLDQDDTTEHRVHGIAFSILAMLDGAAIDLPAFQVMPAPHEDDKAFHISMGESWYPDDVDISGALHELL